MQATLTGLAMASVTNATLLLVRAFKIIAMHTGSTCACYNGTAGKKEKEEGGGGIRK